MKKVYLVPHVHWDREWYFTSEESKNFLVNDMEEYLDRLKKNPVVNTFTLDGQTSILEDYLQLKPEKFEEVKSLVGKNKLHIGPWYTLTDLISLSGTTISRNLMYGIKDTIPFGKWMKIGYVPDPFGSCAQMPQILNNFGIKDYIFWRGISERHGATHTEFNWVGLDQSSKVFTYWMPMGYAIGKYLPLAEGELKARLDKYITNLSRLTTSNSILIPHGHDQMPVQKNILEVIEMAKKLYPDVEFIWTDYQTYLSVLKKEVKELETVRGEFNDGKYMRVHRSIYSTRNDLTILSKLNEHKIIYELEPLLVMAEKWGISYPDQELETIWKLNFENHAHDSLSKCNSDEVNRQIESRFLLSLDKINSLTKFLVRKLSDNLYFENQEQRLVLVNALPYQRQQNVKTIIRTKFKSFDLLFSNQKINFEVLNQKIIDPGILDRQIVHYGNYDSFFEYEILIPHFKMNGASYLTLEIKEKNQQIVKIVKQKKVSEIENNYFKISANKNGSFKIFNKLTKQTWEKSFWLEDGSDEGDEYDYSPMENDWKISSLNVKNAKVNYHQSLIPRIEVVYNLDVPADLEERKKHQVSAEVLVESILELNENKIQVNFKLKNFAKDHRLQVVVPKIGDSKTHFVDVPFGVVEKQNKDEFEDNWQEEHWEEKPCSIWTAQSFVKVKNEINQEVVYSKSLNEYEVDQAIKFTAFRSVGFLGKENLHWRPGRPSGIKIATPDAQLLNKIITFDINLIWKKEGENYNQLLNEIHSEFTPYLVHNITGYQALKMNSDNLNLPVKMKMLEINPQHNVFAGLNKSLFTKNYNLTLWNSEQKVQKLKLSSNEFKILNQTNFLGQKKTNETQIKPFEILNQELK